MTSPGRSGPGQGPAAALQEGPLGRVLGQGDGGLVGQGGLAVAAGFRYLQVDASDNSRPILERLGFVAVTTTTPYVWSPEA